MSHIWCQHTHILLLSYVITLEQFVSSTCSLWNRIKETKFILFQLCAFNWWRSKQNKTLPYLKKFDNDFSLTLHLEEKHLPNEYKKQIVHMDNRGYKPKSFGYTREIRSNRSRQIHPYPNDENEDALSLQSIEQYTSPNQVTTVSNTSLLKNQEYSHTAQYEYFLFDKRYLIW